MKYSIFLFVFVSIALSCSKALESPISENREARKSIEINAELIADTTDISEIVDSIRIIKIDEGQEGLIGGIENLFVIKDNYVIFDPFFSNKIVLYDKEGKFKKNMVKMGSGPLELSKLSDVWVTGEHGLEVFDNYLKKIIVYDSSFNEIQAKFVKNSHYVKSLIRVPRTDKYLGYSGYNGFNVGPKYFKVISLDSTLKLNDAFFPYSSKLHQSMILTPISPFFVLSDTIGFTQDYDPAVYNFLPNGSVFKKYSLIYSPNPLPEDFENEIIMPHLKHFKSPVLDFEETKRIFSGYTGFRGPWLEADKYAIFYSFDLNHSMFASIYNKSEKDIIFQGRNFSESDRYHMQIPPYFYTTKTDENRFISFYEGYIVLLLLKVDSPFYNMVKDDVESFYIIDIRFK